MELDEQFEAFVIAYPASRRQRGFLVGSLFLTAVGKVGFDRLLTAIEQQKRSEQWENPAMIPTMKKWLEEERWIQELPERRTGSDRRHPQRQSPGRRKAPHDEPL